MKEKEKMLCGMLYDPTDDELVSLRNKVRQLTENYNSTSVTESEKREALIHQILGGHKGSAFFEPSIKFDYGCNTYVGENFYANFDCKILDVAKVTIGDNVMFGPNVTLATPCHPLIGEQRRARTRENGETFDLEYGKPITIGNDVWLASNVVVIGGVTIGDNVVIGAGSVVTKDIESGVIAVGNPCKILRKITENDRLKEN